MTDSVLIVALAFGILAAWDLGRQTLKTKRAAQDAVVELKTYLAEREARYDAILKNFIVDMRDVVKALSERDTAEKKALLQQAQARRIR